MTDLDPTQPADPWLSLWKQPRATARQLIDQRPAYAVLLLAGLNGVASSLSQQSSQDAGDDFGLGTILFIAIALGPVVGILGLYFVGWLASRTGRWLGGEAPPAHVRTALAWGGLPNVAGLLLWPPALALAGHELFTSSTPQLDAHPLLALLLIPIGLGWIVLGIWALVATLKTVGEAHGFSAWRALACLLLTIALIVFVVAAVVALLVATGSAAL